MKASDLFETCRESEGLEYIFDVPAKLAAAFDCHGHWVENSHDLTTILESAFNEEEPRLVVPLDYRENNKSTDKRSQITCPI